MTPRGPDPAGDRPDLVLGAAPFLRRGVDTPGLMTDVLIALVPPVLAALWWFGIRAALVLAASVAGAVAAEALLGRPGALRDRSALLTGLLVGLVLPPGIALWMAALGSAVGIALGKVAWGGLGFNAFNPALVGRAFLQAAFPTALTTWHLPGDRLALGAATLAPPLLTTPPDGLSGATPLNRMAFLGEATPLRDLLSGNTGGCLGETSGAAILLGLVWLLARRTCDWRLPTSVMASVAVTSIVLRAAGLEEVPPTLFMLTAGGLLFGAVYMATDPVTTPTTPAGAWIFGIGVGVLVVLIRVWGGLPEGVMYAILVMNAATPLLERVTQPRAYGHRSRLPFGGSST